MAGHSGRNAKRLLISTTSTTALLGSLLLTTSPAATAVPATGAGPCKGQSKWVTVCADEDGKKGKAASQGTGQRNSKEASKDAPVCKYEKLSPQPPAENLAWEGRDPKKSDGAVYARWCDDPTMAIGVVYLEDPPEEDAPDPEVLAREAVDSMKLAGPSIASPKPDGKYLVGMPMWMWVNSSPTTYGPNSATATAGSMSVTATARVQRVVWSMGDGKRVTCTTKGTKYKPSHGKRKSPDCGHVYTLSSSSKSGGTYTVNATSTWLVQWEGGGQSGQFTEARDSDDIPVTVLESQVLN